MESSSNIQQQSDVPVYCSDSEPESQEEPCTKRTRKGGLDWIFVKKFVTFDEAQQFLRDEKIWTAKFTHTTEEGKKQYYRCNKVKYRGPQCAAQIYLLFESNSDAVLLYRTSSDHDHEIIGTKNDYGITQETKDEINKLYALHLKPKAILARLSEINATSSTLFQRAFLHKHAKEEQFISYFKQEWVSLNPNWYLGSAEGSPVTNNALESFNRSIKDSHTLRERLPLSRFISVATNMVKEWSKDHKPETFKTLPPIELKDWTLAYQWAKLDKNVKFLESDSGLNTYIVRSSTASDMTFTQDWDTFDGYKKNAFAYWRVALPTQQTAWVNGKCICPIFFKNYMCKHIIGLAIRLKYVAPPAEAKNVPIGQKRKRGRPAKARPALIIQ
ncbi:hypothetical protein HF086_003110 [Spodoptera exigua]|uniref:SWIM-type domain-containing protein n=1 Tax=Spodoptera exigua TaxID=7107 RepID=A0A922MXM3_SPOEX|nr:hypothetical protein HF086_003110 [Spodoptera exigua]